MKPNPPAIVKRTTPGGIVDGLLKKLGTAPWYFTSTGSGTGLSDGEGNTVDSPGDVGTLSSKQGNTGHVASANLWTTTYGGVPLSFDSETFKANTIIGGNFNLTTYLQEASGEAVHNNVTIKLFDVAPGENGVRKEVAAGAAGYIAGIDPTKGTYAFKIAKPWEILKGHHLTAELSFACACSTTMRFYYGNDTYPSAFTVERFDRVAVQGTKVTKPAMGSKGGHLPATGLGDETTLGLLLLAGAALTLRRHARSG